MNDIGNRKNVNLKKLAGELNPDIDRTFWSGIGETIIEIAQRFGVSRGRIHKWVYPALSETHCMDKIVTVGISATTSQR